VVVWLYEYRHENMSHSCVFVSENYIIIIIIIII
jgi:hypothetical protein